MDVAELAAFAPAEVWDCFRTAYPVLAVYRGGWVGRRPRDSTTRKPNGPFGGRRTAARGRVPAAATAAAAQPDPGVWEALWQRDGDGAAAVADVGAALDWPEFLQRRDAGDRLLPVCTLLWPDRPWAVWTRRPAVLADDAHHPPRVARGAVPCLRRAACLLHGFHLGGCSVRGVFEAMRLPWRATGTPPAVAGAE